MCARFATPRKPAVRGSLAASRARRRHLALSTNLISKISHLAGMDSCVPCALRNALAHPTLVL